MVLQGNVAGNPAGHWCSTPWDENTAEWKRIDGNLEREHDARRIDAVVAQLDLSPLIATYAGVGSRAQRPDLMLKIALYEMCLGRLSPTQWYKDTRENLPVQWLGFGIHPGRSRWYQFAERLAEVVDDFNGQFLALGIELRVTTATRASLDGSLLAANASRRHLLKETTLQSRTDQLTAAIEDDRYGFTRAVVQSCRPVYFHPAWMATTDSGRRRQRATYQQACEEMQKLQVRNQERPASKRKLRGEVRLSVADPAAPLGLDKENVYRPLYNVQVIQDLESPLILAYEVFAQTNDNGTVQTMLDRHRQLTGVLPKQMLADAGYATALEIWVFADAGVELYAPFRENLLTAGKEKTLKQFPKQAFTWLPEEKVYLCPADQRLTARGKEHKRQSVGRQLEVTKYRCDPLNCMACAQQGECTRTPDKGRTVIRSEHDDLIDQLRARMATVEAKCLYGLRKQTIELCYADLKQHRHLRRLNGRGLRRARTQLGLLVLAHNGLTIAKARQTARKQPQSDVSLEGIAA
jgi:transposase